MPWSHRIIQDDDSTCRVEITDEDGVVVPVARGVSQLQAETLLKRIEVEMTESSRPVKAVIRDPYFMAATVITVKRLPG